MRRTIKFLVCLLFATTVGVLALSSGEAQTQVDFKKEIEPIFAESCYACHGPKKAAGQLRLDAKAPAFKGGLSGPVIVPGKGKESLLYTRIHSKGPGGEPQMPMGGDPLPTEKIELIRRWIDEGANWPEAAGAAAASKTEIQKHWAYVKPQQPAPPQPKDAAWVRNPIDAFLLARLEKEGLKPSPEADRATLLRRVYLDVTGLPPNVKEIDQFLADRSPDAYEKVVDRLLASPQYGERWARPWLDLARYADSNGYEKDNLRVAWKFRDWVINAFNRDMPFDQFTIEQIAGDMLPGASLDQKIATGFHRNTMVNQEGGIDPEEARFETLIDRVNTTSTVWLGSTIGCAQCHNHKYDPFSQKDYYRLMAFFDNTEYQIGYQTPGADESRYILEPQIDLPTPEQAEQKKALDAELKALETKLKTQTPELDAAQKSWEQSMTDDRSRWTTLTPIKVESKGGATLKTLEDQSTLAGGPKAELEVYTVTAKTNANNLTALRVEALPDESLPKGGPGRDPYGNFLLTGVEVSVTTAGSTKSASIVDAAVDDSAYRIELKQFLGLEPPNTATDRPTGWFVNATNDQTRVARQGVFVFLEPLRLEPNAVLTVKLKHLGGSLNQAIGRFRLSVTSEAEPKKTVSISARLRPVLAMPEALRSEKQRTDLSAQFRALTPSLKPERDRLEKLRDELKALKITPALVMQERPSYDRPATFFRERGSFLNKADKVFASTPAVLSTMPESEPVNRLGLARWLVDENNPLTARVLVNRYWEQIFGRGIVETSEDFGLQGERPVHPELLDWLAAQMMKPRDKGGMGWSQKQLVKLLVTSAAYRQSSVATPALLEKDPYNRLLARGPRFRMEAEMIRDVTLAVSGSLSLKLGGPSVFPLQPDGVWKAPYSNEKWLTSKGEDRYRRSLYTFVRRSSPHPAMMTFDATSREYCTVRRVRTNTPLQALTMLNDEASMDAARALTRRILAESPEGLKAQIDYGFRLCASRPAKPRETERLLALFQQQSGYFKTHDAEALKILKDQFKTSTGLAPAELAAWTMVANVLLNLDETLTKE
jgi:hypothetical protein